LKGHGFSRAVASINQAASYSVNLTTEGRKNPSDAKVANPKHPAEIIRLSGLKSSRPSGFGGAVMGRDVR